MSTVNLQKLWTRVVYESGYHQDQLPQSTKPAGRKPDSTPKCQAESLPADSDTTNIVTRFRQSQCQGTCQFEYPNIHLN
jgi:hypothetical protein